MDLPERKTAAFHVNMARKGLSFLDMYVIFYKSRSTEFSCILEIVDECCSEIFFIELQNDISQHIPFQS